MSNPTGSYVYILAKDMSHQEIKHKKTLNEAKFYGLDFFYKKDEPFYRFTKIPFPHLFYSSPSYLVYVEHARFKDEGIPYVKELTTFDEEMKENMALFSKAFDKRFFYHPEARAKYRDPNKRDKRNRMRRIKGKANRRKHFNAFD